MRHLSYRKCGQLDLGFSLPVTFVCAIVSSLLMADTNAGPIEGGSSPSGIVNRMEAEIAKRTADAREAAALQESGDKLMADKDYAGAMDKFRKAIDLLPQAPMVNKQRAAAMESYAAACVSQARLLAGEGRYDEATVLLNTVLTPTMLPDHPGAQLLKKQLLDPERFNPAMTPDFPPKVIKVQKLLNYASGFIDLGDFKSALAAYNQVLSVDPHNAGARRGMEKCEKFISDYQLAARDHTRAKMITDIDRKWETAVPDIAMTPRLPGANQGSNVSPVASKLRGIIFPKLSLDSADLSEVILFLVAKCREYDQFEAEPSKKGINILLKLPLAEQAKLPKVTLNLNDVPLYQVLDYVADQTGTKWKLADGLVSFTSIAAAGTKLSTRIFSVPPGFLSSAPAGDAAAPAIDPFASATPGGAAGAGIPVQKVGAQDFLEKSGVPFPPGASASFDKGNSRLVVTNTDENLDAVDTFVSQILSKATKQVLIRVTRLEINENTLNELGLDILMGQFNLTNRLFGGGGTYGTKGTPTSPVLDYPFMDPAIAAGNSVPTGQLPLTGGLRGASDINSTPSINSLLQGDRYAAQPSKLSPGIFGLVGQFTDPQFQIVVRALDQRKGADLSSSIEVVVKSGQIAKASAVREFIWPTDYDPPQIPQNTGGIGNNDPFNNGGVGQFPGGGGNAPVTPAIPTTFKMTEVGNRLEVEATIAEDNSSVDLRMTPEFSEFLGFINYGSPINSISSNGIVTVATLNQIVQPVFEIIRTPNIAVTVYDGNTIAFGGLKQSQVNEINDKVPILGDIPLIGRLFRSSVKSSQRKAIILFVTVNIQDPAGRRVAPLRGTVDAAPDEPAPGN